MQLNRESVFLALGLASSVLIAGCADTSVAPNVPLSSGMTPALSAPAANVPASLAAFAGKWGGYWDGALPSNLIVESVNAQGDASGIYSWGTGAGVSTPGATRFRARIENGVLQWGGGGAPRFEFRISPDGRLLGNRFVSVTPAGQVTMVKM